MCSAFSGLVSSDVTGLVAEASRLGVRVMPGEPLARHTTFRIGGPAELYAAVQTTDQLARLAELGAAFGLPVLILGGGSNVLVSDAGVRGLVIANQTRRFEFQAPDSAGADNDSPLLVADSGVALAGLARSAIRAGWSGLEWAISVPGTVGGAVIGNAGAHGGEIALNLTWASVCYAGRGRGRQVLGAAELSYAYRNSALKQQLLRGDAIPVVLEAGFQLQRGDVTEMSARAEAYLAKRRASQPVEPSAGSIFRNPPGEHAGRLIEAAGLKGTRVGGAMISPRHANFVVNDTGDARAADVISLIQLTRSRVYENSGIELMPEIVFVGEWPKGPLSAVAFHAELFESRPDRTTLNDCAAINEP